MASQAPPRSIPNQVIVSDGSKWREIVGAVLVLLALPLVAYLRYSKGTPSFEPASADPVNSYSSAAPPTPPKQPLDGPYGGNPSANQNTSFGAPGSHRPSSTNEGTQDSGDSNESQEAMRTEIGNLNREIDDGYTQLRIYQTQLESTTEQSQRNRLNWIIQSLADTLHQKSLKIDELRGRLR